MESQICHSLRSRAEPWIALALCAAVLLGRSIQHLAPNGQVHAEPFALDWIALAAVGFAAAGILRLEAWPQWVRVERALLWSGFLLMVWAANGLIFDLFAMAGMMPWRVNWVGLATRSLALAAAVVLARLALARTDASALTGAAKWYGYAAFVLALPYPVLRMHWALGGMLGLQWPGAGGRGFAPLLIAIPFVLAAVLSLLLVSPRRWMPRWLLLTAGWTATALVATIGPAASWALVTKLAHGNGADGGGIAIWVYALFYGSWLLWAIAAGAATRSYQLRSANAVIRKTASSHPLPG